MWPETRSRFGKSNDNVAQLSELLAFGFLSVSRLGDSPIQARSANQ